MATTDGNLLPGLVADMGRDCSFMRKRISRTELPASVGPPTLASVSRDNATLITFGTVVPLIPAFLMVLMAATLRLWATIIEDRAGLRLDPYADSWIFLPTILEDELDEARVRREYEGLY